MNEETQDAKAILAEFKAEVAEKERKKKIGLEGFRIMMNYDLGNKKVKVAYYGKGSPSPKKMKKFLKKLMKKGYPVDAWYKRQYTDDNDDYEDNIPRNNRRSNRR